jgi:hypothetical protein
MATFKLNIANLDNCPPPADVAAAMEDFGLREEESFGVLNCTASEKAVLGTVVHRTVQDIQQLDEETGEVTSRSVNKVNVYPLGIYPDAGRIETYGGPATGLDRIAEFLASGLALPTIVNQIELDVVSAIDKLYRSTEKFQLKSIRVSEYAHSSYVCGPYAPKFLDTEHGRDFLTEFADFVTAANCRFQGEHGRVTVNLKPKANYSYSLSNEDDNSAVQSILRKLA